MLEKWLIIGVSGVTCGGKTTLSTELNKIIEHSVMISQDDYFLDVNDARHTWIPELNHINFDIISSLDMEKMYADVLKLIKNKETDRRNVPVPTKTGPTLIQCTNIDDLKKMLCTKVKSTGLKVLIIEGFCIFNYKPIADLCCLKYYFTLTKDECHKRRVTRIYEPPDCPGYFEKCAWPEYLKLLDDVQANVKDVKYFDGTSSPPYQEVLMDISLQL